LSDHEPVPARSAGEPRQPCGADIAPPRLAEWLLGRCLPAGLIGRSIRGDLHREYADLRDAVPGRSQGGWYWRQAAKLGARYIYERGRLRFSRRSAADPGSPKGPVFRMEGFVQDLRFGVRTLFANPGFTAIAVITLALGIGANTAMFSVINGVLLRPLDYPDPEALVLIKRFDLTEQEAQSNTTPGNFFAWRERSQSFAAMAVLHRDIAALTAEGDTYRVGGMRSAGSLLGVLGTPALIGRTLTVADDETDQQVVVLSYGLWQEALSGDRAAIGQSIVLDGAPYTVVGVMPESFQQIGAGSLGVDFWRPSGWTPEYRENHTNYAHTVLARLAPGVSLERAQQEMDVIGAELRREYPRANRDHGIQIVPLHNELVAGVDALLFLLMGAVGVVLLIATVNLANLLLARASSRQQEIGVRKAIGATPGRLARQMLTESVLLAFAGGAAGLGLAFWMIDIVTRLIPVDVEQLERVSIDGYVLLFTALAATTVGVVFGLLPAIRLARQPVGEAMSGQSRGSTRTSWAWSALVVAEVALSVVLLAGAGLLLRTFVNLMLVDPGYRPDHVMTFTVSAPQTYDTERRMAFWTEIRNEIEGLPGVTAAAVANQLPSEFSRVSGWFNFVDRPVDNSDRSFLVPYRLVSVGYFETMGIPVLRGRAFSDADHLDPPGAIINEAARESFWGDTDPIGDRIGIGNSEGELFFPGGTVVGVVSNVKNDGRGAATRPAVYFPVEFASGWGNLTFALRTEGDPTSVLRAARDRVHRLEPGAPVYGEATIEQMLAEQVAPTRSILQLIGAFAGLGLAMAAIGVFGVLSYSVSRRTHEIGIRAALGANAFKLTAMVVGQAMSKVLLGTGLGLVAALFTNRFLATMLFDVSPTDPVTIAGVTIVLCLVALLASYLPARRATRVDPTVALRSE